jgi:hypothetical protein
MMVEREVDGDMLHLLPLQVVVLAAAVVVSVGQADFEAVVTVIAAVMLLAAEVEMGEVEWTEPTSQSAKHMQHA